MRALQTAATGMMAQELNVQVISNNIANVRTTGYKRQRVHFQDLLYEHHRRAGSATSEQNTMVPAGISIGSGVKTVSTGRVMTLEWIRRRDPKLDEYLRTYLFTSGSILAIEEGDQGEKPSLVDKAMDKATEVATGLAGKLGQNVSELVTQALEGPAKPARKHPAKRK